jgi:predicted DNA-binding protein YlxM (UPF0122 family)
MTKAEIKRTLIELLSAEDFDTVAGKIQKIASDFMLELKEEERKIEKLQMDIDNEFEVDAENLQLNNDIKELIERFKLIRKEIKQEKTKQENDNLKQKEQLLKEFKQLVENEEHIGKAIIKIQEIRNQWNSVGNIPRDKYQDIQSEYSRLNDLFSYNIQIFKELKEHDLKKNYSLKNQIVHELSLLSNEKDIKTLEQNYRQLQNSWNEIGATYQDKWEDLKNRYWEQVKLINERIKAHYESLKQQKEDNLTKKKALIEKVTTLTSDVKESVASYEKITKELLEIQNEWNKIGQVEKSVKDDIWKAFRTANDAFFAKKAAFFSEKKEEWQKHAAAKQKLVERAEELKSSTDWDNATKKILKIQEEWKAIGHAGAVQEQKLWKKLRDASDVFFTSKRSFLDQNKNEEKENLKQKQELIAAINNFTPSANQKENLLALKEFSDAFNAIGNVPFKDKNKIYEHFKQAIDQKNEQLNISTEEKESMLFDIRMEKASAEEAKLVIASERKRIYAQIKHEEDTLKKYENNLGFFNISKSGEGLFKNVEETIKQGKQKIELLKTRLAVLKAKEKEVVTKD